MAVIGVHEMGHRPAAMKRGVKGHFHTSFQGHLLSGLLGL